MGAPKSAQGLKKLLCVVRAAHKWAACHFRKPHLEGFVPPFVKFFRWNETLHGEVLLGGLKILSQREEAAARVKKIPECLEDLFGRLPKPQHEARLGGNRRVKLLDPAQQLDGSFINGPWPYCGAEAGYGLNIVIQHIWMGLDDALQGMKASLKVRYEDLHLGIGSPLPDRSDSFCKVYSTTILKVIARYRGDDHMAQSHLFDSLCHPCWFFGIWRS